MTANGLRATRITRLFQAVYQKEVISSRTGHLNPSSVLSYLNTDGLFGNKMHDKVFNVTGQEGAKKSRMEALGVENVADESGQGRKVVSFNDVDSRPQDDIILDKNSDMNTPTGAPSVGGVQNVVDQKTCIHHYSKTKQVMSFSCSPTWTI